MWGLKNFTCSLETAEILDDTHIDVAVSLEKDHSIIEEHTAVLGVPQVHRTPTPF